MDSRVKITELVLRDGHQSMIATRMRTEDMLPIIDKMDEVGYYSMEMWGGATFDVCMRFLNEDPWERLRALRKAVKKTKLQMLLRGQNLVGYRHYPDDIVVKFVEAAAKNGIDVFRVFDALNDVRNMEVSIRTAKKCGAIVEGSISYTISPVHTVEKYVSFAKELASLDSDIICIKDMAGLMTPNIAAELTQALIKEVGLPVHVHSHTTSGLALMSLFAACEAGAEHLDTVISPFSQGSSHPPTETVVAALKGTPYDTGLDLELLVEIAAYFLKVKDKYRDVLNPIAERIDTNVLVHQIPGGMLSNLVSQLKEQNALDKYNEVLKEVPKVRAELGYPPLVTPTSQIVGTQAVFNVITGSRFKLISNEVRNYVKGLYGRPPASIDEKVKKLAIGDEPVIDRRPADSLEPMFEKAKSECGEWCESIEDILSYALFPQVATEFFKRRKTGIPAGAPAASGIAQGAQRKKIAIVGTGGEGFDIQVGDKKYDVKVVRSGSSMTVSIGNRVYEVDVGSIPRISQRGVPQRKDEFRTEKPGKPVSKKKVHAKGAVVAPMPGKVVSIEVKEGDSVDEGQRIITLEAMKMQNEILSPKKGRVKEILVQVGAAVNSDDVMIIIE
jgi:pyruvate carboxylase subunit B